MLRHYTVPFLSVLVCFIHNPYVHHAWHTVSDIQRPASSTMYFLQYAIIYPSPMDHRSNHRHQSSVVVVVHDHPLLFLRIHLRSISLRVSFRTSLLGAPLCIHLCVPFVSLVSFVLHHLPSIICITPSVLCLYSLPSAGPCISVCSNSRPSSPPSCCTSHDASFILQSRRRSCCLFHLCLRCCHHCRPTHLLPHLAPLIT